MLKNSQSVHLIRKEVFLAISKKARWSKLNVVINYSPAFEEVAFKTPVGKMS
jgi:hypothetical protein